MTDTDIGTIEQELRIAARPETVWRYWTEPERLLDWWGSSVELDPQPGGAYVVSMDHGATMRGQFVELVPHERIVFTFGWDPREGSPDVAPGSTRVEITLIDDDGDTILMLRHTGFSAAGAELHQLGWAQHLPHLVSAISSDR